MLNEKIIRTIYSKPKIKTEDAKQKEKDFKKPKDLILKLVVNKIKQKKGITRQQLKKSTGLSFNCLNRCFKYLLDKNTIKRVAIKNAGAYKVYSYYIKE